MYPKKLIEMVLIIFLLLIYPRTPFLEKPFISLLGWSTGYISTRSMDANFLLEQRRDLFYDPGNVFKHTAELIEIVLFRVLYPKYIWIPSLEGKI